MSVRTQAGVVATQTASSLGCLKLGGLLKASFVVGSFTAMFSGVNCVTPLVGMYGGSFVSLLVFGALAVGKYAFYGFFGLKQLAFVLPGLCASLYFSTQSIFFRFVLPFVCIMLFTLHPVGFYAAPYSLFWVVPIVVFFCKPQQFFWQALSATLVAHAVGSTIWIYAMPMSSSVWLWLIPVVALERTVFAMGIVALARAVEALKNVTSIRVLLRQCTE